MCGLMEFECIDDDHIIGLCNCPLSLKTSQHSVLAREIESGYAPLQEKHIGGERTQTEKASLHNGNDCFSG